MYTAKTQDSLLIQLQVKLRNSKMRHMIERAHLNALRASMAREEAAIDRLDSETQEIASRQTSAVMRSLKASRQIFSEFGVSDIAIGDAIEFGDIETETILSLDPNEEKEVAEEYLKDKNFGQSIKFFRKRARMTIRDFQARSGMDDSMVSKLETTDRDPTISTFGRLVRGFGWELDDWRTQLLLKKAVEQHPKPKPRGLAARRNITS